MRENEGRGSRRNEVRMSRKVRGWEVEESTERM